MVSLDLIRKVTVQYQSTGAEKAAADYDKLTSAQDKAAASATRVEATTEKLSRTQLSVSGATERYVRAMDPAARAQAQVERGERLMAAARAQGLPITAAMNNALELARKRHEEYSKAAEANTRAIGLNRMQMMEFGHVARSVADSVAAGANPLRVLSQEGGRVAQIFTEGQGGVGGTFKALTSQVGRLAFSWVGLGLAAAGASAIGAGAALSWASAQSRLAASLNGVGRASGLNLAGLNSAARAAATAGGLSTPEARTLMAGFAGTGTISGSLGQSLAGSSRRFGDITGQSTADAGAMLAKLFADPSAGAKGLSKIFGDLDARTLELIQSEQARGEIVAAQKTLLDSFSASLKAATDNTWKLQDWAQNAKNAGANFLDRIGAGIAELVAKPPLAVQQTDIQAQIGVLSRERGQEGNVARLRAQYETNQQILDKEAQRAQADARQQAATRLGNQAADAVRAALPDFVRANSLADRIGLLRNAAGNSDAMHGLEGFDVNGALSRSLMQQRNLDPGRRAAQDDLLSIQNSQARTLAEKIAVDAEKARLQVLRDTGDALQAAAAAESARNEQIAAANRQAQDVVKQSGRDLQMAGMSPYQRGRQEIENRFADLREQLTASPTQLANAMRPQFSTDIDRLGDAATRAADALDRIANDNSPYGSVRAPGSISGGASGPWGSVRAPGSISGNNPGNLEVSSFSAGQPGFIGGGRFASFATPADGYRAANNLLTSYVHRGYRTPAAIINRWAPRSDGNDPAAYGASIAKIAGLDPNATLGFDAQSRSRLLFAMTKVEHGSSPYGESAIAGMLQGKAPVGLTTAGAVATAHSQSVAAYNIESIQQPFKQSNQALKDQNLLLDVQQKAFGKSKAELEGLLAAQKLYNDFTDAGVTVTAAMNEQIQAYGAGVTTLNRRQEQMQRQQDAMGAVRDVGSSFIDSVAQGLATRHRNVHQTIFGSAMHSVGTSLLSSGERALTGALFGGGRDGGNGVLGSLFASLFGGVGGGGAPMQLHFAGGGVMTSRGPLALRRYAGGGVADSPQLAMFGEGSGPEAYVPLPDGRSIPVNMRGRSGPAQPGHTFNSSTTIVMNGGDDPKRQASQLQAELDRRDAKLMQNVQRNVGSMQSTWNRRYGKAAG
jgi:hypothetical protein